MKEQNWEKRARELQHSDVCGEEMWPLHAVMELGRRMADARAEEIARQLEITMHICGGPNAAAAIARATITKPEPKTREDVLEEALRKLDDQWQCKYQSPLHPPWHDVACECDRCHVRRALEWKPK